MLAPVTFTLNGRPVSLEVGGDEALLDSLRHRLGVLSVKDGCSPQGQCGACAALVDGHARTTCNLPTANLEGHDVVTLEGLTDEERARLVRAFESAQAGQCGFCLPAMALHAHAFTAAHPEPSHGDIAKALDQHLCRCGGHERLIHAVQLLAKARHGEMPPEPPRQGGVGASVGRAELAPLVLGERPFVADMRRPDMLFGAAQLSPHARARVLEIDGTMARAMPGVVAILTAADVPGNRWQGLLLADWPVLVATGEEVRCVGDVVAIVAAESEAQARAAAEAVVVTYEPLPPVLSPEEALAPGAPRVSHLHDNLLSLSEIRRGDVDKALAESAHVVRATFTTQRIEHAFLEPESALAEPVAGGKLALFSQGQGIFDDRRQVASILGVAPEDVLVTLVPSGGAFGGKEDLSVQGHAALLARATGRPVMFSLTREQSIRMHPKRHPMTLAYEVGCDAEGKLTAVRARITGDTGAYASVGAKVLERSAGHAAGPYRVANVDVEARAVSTNNPPCGAMRGFGVPQVAFALEGCLDELAGKVGLDAWEIRWRNAIVPGDAVTSGQRLTASVGIQRTLLAVKPAYDAARAEGRAVGIACGLKNSGIGNGVAEWGRACLTVEKDGTVSVRNGYTEMGQGLSTVLAQIASEVTGLPVATFVARTDTSLALDCGQTTGSRATLFGGRAVQSAARKLRAELDGGARLQDLAGRSFAASELTSDTTPLGANVASPKTHTSYGFATQVVVLDAAGKLARVIAAHDVGHAVNPSLCAAQIEGGVVMGLGYALSEELRCEGGMPTTFYLRELGPLRARDVPPVQVILVEEPEPEGPFGAKGIGEIGMVPTAAAVAGALFAFDGARRRALPMRDSKAAAALGTGHLHKHDAPIHHPHAHPREPGAR